LNGCATTATVVVEGMGCLTPIPFVFCWHTFL